jgi:solute carrier family 6 amino acid transporter-like protein 5/7/9/14
MFSSYNRFRVNLLRDVLIFVFADTATSILSGLTTFAILGNLAHEVGANVDSLVLGNDLGLAFITYPDAIVKIHWAPQVI